jgi:excisionase family DNA binding protein
LERKCANRYALANEASLLQAAAPHTGSQDLPFSASRPILDPPELTMPASASAGAPVPDEPPALQLHPVHTTGGHDRRTYTVDETAALLGISRSSAYECVRRGEIPSVRFGRRIVVLRDVLDRLLRDAGAVGD